MAKRDGPESVKDILGRLLGKHDLPQPGMPLECGEPPGPTPPRAESRYDFDLAEFPLFRLYKNGKPAEGR